jgi:hypothetical protein
MVPNTATLFRVSVQITGIVPFLANLALSLFGVSGGSVSPGSCMEQAMISLILADDQLPPAQSTVLMVDMNTLGDFSAERPCC